YRGRDSNPRPSGYEPDELPDCSTPRRISCSSKKRVPPEALGTRSHRRSRDEEGPQCSSLPWPHRRTAKPDNQAGHPRSRAHTSHDTALTTPPDPKPLRSSPHAHG